MTTAVATEQITISAEVRETIGKETNKKLRRKGLIPAIMYGADFTPVSLTLSRHELHMAIQHCIGLRKLIKIQFPDGSSENVFFKEFQRHPVTDLIIHADFLRVQADKEVVVRVPVRKAGGIPLGVRQGGLLESIRLTTYVKAKPADVPEVIEYDLTNLALAQSVHVCDLPALPGVTYVDDPKTTIFTIAVKGKVAKEAYKAMKADEKKAEAAAAAAAAAAESEEE
ncbi:MAG: 50S ribosomal protein L25 [Candidatus Sumerlaeia bacterium]|nr:50S ribosomal protein L25 [Candidatus Sumerlaeia bacterium]